MKPAPTIFSFNDYSDMVFDTALFNKNRSDLKSLDQQIRLTTLKQETERQSLKPEFGVRFENMYGFGGQPMQYTAMAMVKTAFCQLGFKDGAKLILQVWWAWMPLVLKKT